MGKKMLCALLCLGLCVGPVRAAESGFADVGDGDWFAPYVQVCVEHGLMEGTGEGRFSPGGVLTDAEAMTLAFRLYDLRQGGDGRVEKAPEDWGRLTMTLANGEEITGYGDSTMGLGPFSYFDGYSQVGCLTADLYHDDVKGVQAVEGPATVTVNGRTYAGRTQFVNVTSGLTFFPEGEGDLPGEAWTTIQAAFYRSPSPDKWWRDVCYTIVKRGWADVIRPEEFSPFSAYRWEFAKALASAAGELEKRNDVPSLPDLDRDAFFDGMIYTLYEAGILTGVDEYGTFAGERTLTRSEAAAMLARVAEPSLRLDFTPAQPELQRAYTLTAVELPQGWVPTADSNKVAAGWAAIQRVENETVAEEAICRADGTVLGLEGYFVYGFEHLTSRGSAKRLLVQTYGAEISDYEAARGSLWNIYDVEQERLLLEKGMSEDDPAWKAAQETYLPSPLSTWPRPRLDEGSGLYGYVDREGNWVIAPQYDLAGSFADGAAVVHFRDGETTAAAIDETGREILPRRYSELWYLGEGAFSYWGDLSSWEGDDWQTDCGIVTMEGVEMPSATFSGYFNGGLAAHHGLVAVGHEDGNNWVMAYYDYAGKPVTEDFDWAGPIGEDGAGFVCKDGRLCRIQF